MNTNVNVEGTHISNMMIFYTEDLKNSVSNNMGFVPLKYKGIKEGLYMINPYGDIYSNTRKRVMKQDLRSRDNYFQVKLVTDDTMECKSVNIYTHKLVAGSFIENPFPEVYTEVNHIVKNDGTPEKNHFTNLEWCTRSQNMYHAYEK